MNTNDIFRLLLIIHITAGFTSFIVAPVALIVKKGGEAHRRWGRIFFWSMSVVAFTAVIMAPMRNNLFLTLVAVFSFYLAFSGYRAVRRRRNQVTRRAGVIDWLFVCLNTIFSIGLVIFGIIRLPESFGYISIVFGSLGTALGVKDMVSFIRPEKKMQWFFNHITGMTAAYIASVSAFSAVNLDYDWMPPVIQWLWPTIIGVPLMMRRIRRYRVKFNSGRRLRDEVILRS
jgi:hypothetical protein